MDASPGDGYYICFPGSVPKLDDDDDDRNNNSSPVVIFRDLGCLHTGPSKCLV